MMANPIENINEVMRLLIANRIDVTDLSESQRKEIYYQANEMIFKEMNLLNQILPLPTNANLDIENWLKGSGNYQKGLYLKNLIESFYQKKEEKPKPKQNKKLTSYKWQGNPNKELPELYKLIKDKYNFIATETTYEQFKAIFTGQPIDENFKPIQWHQDNASELLYFIDRLEKLNNIAHNPNRADYEKLKACFVKPNGKPFNEALKSLKTNLEINLSQEKQKAINELVENF